MGYHGNPYLGETTVSNDASLAGVFGASDAGAGVIGYSTAPGCSRGLCVRRAESSRVGPKRWRASLSAMYKSTETFTCQGRIVQRTSICLQVRLARQEP